MFKLWSCTEDRLTLTAILRPGAKFCSVHRPFTAEETKWSIEYAQDLNNGAASGAVRKGVEVRALDSATLELKLPDVLPNFFSLVATAIIDPPWGITPNARGGALKLHARTPGVEMRLVRDLESWARAAAAWSAYPAMTVQEAIAHASDTPVSCPALTEQEVIAYAWDTPVSPAVRAALDQLTRYEREVVSFLSAGLTDREIAYAMVASEITAHTHVRKILGKLRLHSRAELAAWAVNGWTR